MKYHLLLALSALLFPLTGAEVKPLIDASKDTVNTYFHFKDKGQNAEPGECEGRKALLIEYNRTEAPHCEAALSVPGRPLSVGPFKKAVLELEVYIPEEAGITYISFRILDRDEEFLNVWATIPAETRGWKTYRIPVDNTKTLSGWGGKIQNKTVDFPARLYGFSLDFRDRAGTGWIGLGKITIAVEE